jgi:hypothetical protein
METANKGMAATTVVRKVPRKRRWMTAACINTTTTI